MTVQNAWIGFASIWIINFLLSLFTALVANGIFAVPIYQVINTMLACMLFWVYAGLIFVAIALALSLVTFQFSNLLQAFVLLIFYVFLPFASIWSFSLYSWLGHLKLDGAFVSTDYINQVGGVLRFAAGLLKGIWPGVNTAVSNDNMMRWLQIMAAVATILGLFKGWRSVQS
jgi:hypothetical protein